MAAFALIGKPVLTTSEVLSFTHAHFELLSSEHFGQLAWQFKRVSGSSGLKVQAAIAYNSEKPMTDVSPLFAKTTDVSSWQSQIKSQIGDLKTRKASQKWADSAMLSLRTDRSRRDT
jgi:hypothetical protein